MKKILFLICMLFISIKGVFALTYAGCDYSTVSRLKSLVTNVNITYDYRYENDRIVFDVTLVNITPEMSFKDSVTSNVYTYQDTNNGEITIRGYTTNSGSYKFYSTISGCERILYGTKYYNFPIYNEFYGDPLCADNDYDVCKKWVKSRITYKEFMDYINASNKEDTKPEKTEETDTRSLFDYIISFYVKYYYLILPFIIIACGLVIYIKRKKERFKF